MKKLKLELKSGGEDDKEVINQVLPKPTAFTSPKTSPMLPPETWNRIFGEFHSTDFLSVINSTPEWNQLLSSRKTIELFPSVLPFIMEFLPRDDFYNTRLICQDWKKGADFVLETHPSRLASLTSELTFPDRYSQRPPPDTGVKFQDDVESLEQFMSEMSLDSGNPFPGRCVWLSLRQEDTVQLWSDDGLENYAPIDDPQFWSRLIELLTQFGEHIWYLQLDYNYDDMDLEVETRLRNILQLVPNLRRLKLKLATQFGLGGISSTRFNERVGAYFAAEPPSKLEKLEVFSHTIQRDDKGLYPVILQLVKSYCAGGNLKRLGLECRLNGEPISLPELLELSTDMNIKMLPKLKEASPKLEKLSVQFRVDIDCDSEESVEIVDEEEVRGCDEEADGREDEVGVEEADEQGREAEGKGGEREFGEEAVGGDEESEDDEEEVYGEDEEMYDDDLLSSSSTDDINGWNISIIFDGLHLFGDTLKELKIVKSSVTHNWGHENYEIKLPKLESLCFNYTLPTRHLFALKSLKYLEIEDSPVFQDETYGAELFEQLPKLEKVVHTRMTRYRGKETRVVVRPKL